MAFFTQALYLISTGLLVPVIIILFLLFLQSLLLLGSFYASYIARLKRIKQLNEFIPSLTEVLKSGKGVQAIDFSSVKLLGGTFSKTLNEIAGTSNKVISEKALSDFELVCESDLERGKMLLRLGPMFGLMGTLIPMAPALAGLASGNLSAMAENMQVAFSTTVIGVFVGAIGYFNYTLKRRWFKEDMRNLEFVRSALLSD